MHQGWVCQAAQMGWCACQGKVMRARRCTVVQLSKKPLETALTATQQAGAGYAASTLLLSLPGCIAVHAQPAVLAQRHMVKMPLHTRCTATTGARRMVCMGVWDSTPMVRATGLTSTSTAVAVATQSQPTKSLVWWCSAAPTLMPDLILRPR